MVQFPVQHEWRLVDTGSLGGFANMAIDEALLAKFDPASSRPVLRLYGWHPPAFSLGRYQQAAAVLDLDHCAERGIEVVRRITGGGVIYHAEELTYSIVCAPSHVPAARSVKETFAHLCNFLLLFYGKMGLAAGFAVDSSPAHVKLGGRTAFCFAGKEEYDIVIAGRKVGGNAQRRTKGVIFQHGSIPLRPAVSTAQSFLREKTADLDKSTASLAELGVETGEDALKKVMVESFAESMGIIFRPEALTQEELDAARLLEETKYGSLAWNVSGTTPMCP